MSMALKQLALAGLFLVALGLSFGCLGYGDLAVNTVGAQNLQRNYEWFKAQESAMSQIQAQVCYAKGDLDDFKTTYGANASAWTKTTKDDYDNLMFVKSGYVSKYNALASDYNAHRASFIKSFGRDPQVPIDYAPFMDAKCG